MISFDSKVKSYLQKDSEQILQTKTDERGKFGRILGEFVADDTTVNQLLIDTHNAVAYHGQSKEDIAEEHLENRKHVVMDDQQHWR